VSGLSLHLKATIIGLDLHALEIVVIALLVLLFRQVHATKQSKARFSGIIDADVELVGGVEETAKRRAEADDVAAKHQVIETRYKNVTGAETVVKSMEKQAVQIGNDVEEPELNIVRSEGYTIDCRRRLQSSTKVYPSLRGAYMSRVLNLPTATSIKSRSRKFEARKNL
jgi:hypothetical protein